jgi:hypothetical protein
MREWGGRGCGGGPRPRVGNSGIPANDWANFGKEIGVKMREMRDKGFCEGCNFWSVNGRTLAQSEKMWGPAEDDFKKRNSSCQLTPEEWNNNCPVVVKEKTIKEAKP